MLFSDSIPVNFPRVKKVSPYKVSPYNSVGGKISGIPITLVSLPRQAFRKVIIAAWAHGGPRSATDSAGPQARIL